MFPPAWQKWQYLFDKKYRNKFLVYSLKDFAAEPEITKPLLFVVGKVMATQPIKDCGEPLYPLQEFLSKHNSRILLTAGEAGYGAQDLSTHALRQNAAERLLKAEEFLKQFNKNFTLKITDSFRPLPLQKKYFDKINRDLAAQGFTGEELYNRTTQVIADPDSHPPHSTGGTLDLTIYDLSTNSSLPMGSTLDGIDDPLARTFHPDVPLALQKNRLILYTALTEAGFVNSPSEWWHYSYGDKVWAIRNNQPHAIYDSYLKK